MWAVFAKLQQHRLFVKRSKCAFGEHSIAYMGHAIFAAGVAMDPTKVQAALKTAVTTAPVLALSDFARPFTVECDASTHGFRAVLLQDKHPIAYFSRPVVPRHRSLTAYECELIGLVHAIHALSCRDTDDGVVLAISAPRFNFITCLRQAQATDPALVAIRDELAVGSRAAPWSLTDGLVTYDGRLYVPPSSPLLPEIMAAVHEDGHEGVQCTLHRLHRDFHFPDMRRLVQDFVRACATCQRYKSEHLHPAGLLLPLPVPTAVWADIGLDFMEALPRVRGKSVILTVVDRFSKYYHFIPLAHPYSAESVA
ncbi:uncharacterized protein [Miscanthus floridulus]|uniref:uncharacterized protein n=1 Tax=Miscanthus floridulus TaxID=154761 RepID=UPI00345AD941